MCWFLETRPILLFLQFHVIIQKPGTLPILHVTLHLLKPCTWVLLHFLTRCKIFF